MMPEPLEPCVVLGAGIAGLAAAYAARQAGVVATVYEACDHPGGLLATFSIDRFRFDRGVHLSFAAEPAVRAIFDQAPSHIHHADAVCWDHGQWLRHPAQTNMYPLPTEEKIELIAGLAAAPQSMADAPATYRDWLLGQYGEAIATRWPLVYTSKYWTLDAAKLGTAWVGPRMRRADLCEILRGALEPDPPSTYYLRDMRYPRTGGYGSFIAPLIDGATIHTGAAAVRIDPLHRCVEFGNRQRARYRTLVSTIPLPQLVQLIEKVPASVREDATSLFATSLDLVSIGFRRVIQLPSLWFYIYDRGILAARAHAPHRKSPDNAPEGCSSLQFEIYASRARPQHRTPAELVANCVAALGEMRLAQPEDILFADHRRVPFANVVFDLGMEQRRDHVRAWLATQHIHLAGRFGEWEYFWSNQAMTSGLQAGAACGR